MATPAQSSATVPSRPPDAGKGEATIGTYKKLEEIGKGSFATVYKAIYLAPQKPRSYVAIKSVTLAKLNKKLKDNLSSEIDILKRLQHPHIVSLIDCKESTAHIHLVMEYCALGDLSYFIKKRDTLGDHEATRDMIAKYPNPRTGGLNEVVVRHFLKQLASALAFLRDRNLIHRDVKPQNLLLNPSPLYYVKEQPSIMPYATTENSFIPVAGVESLPMLKIADFGFARSLPATSLAETLCGSPLYMAPEILRYEKYDAKADLWSVGTVLFEMVTGKPPFRAANHVELLRKIERNDDKINFPSGPEISDLMKKLIRSLLKRGPIERLSFADFFGHPIITDPIPGLVGSDRPPEKPRLPPQTGSPLEKQGVNKSAFPETERPSESVQPALDSTRNSAQDELQRAQSQRSSIQQSQEPSQRPASMRRISSRDKAAAIAYRDQPSSPLSGRRPSIVSHSTAPGRQELLNKQPLPAVVMERQRSRNTPSPNPSLLQEQVQKKQDDRASRDERERAAQDVAFERDYVVVEKKAVEVNAFADELAASPRIHGGNPNVPVSPTSGAMVRRATTQGAPNSITGAQVTPSRAMQIAQGRPRDVLHNRQGSYERRYGPSPASATSAISKALNMASGRLFGVGFSPPQIMARGGRSPPTTYSPFPAYPTSQGSLVVIGDGGKSQVALDEDSKAVHNIEECATRSDVVFGFAEVKYKQLIPLAPSTQGMGVLRQVSQLSKGDQDCSDCADEGLTVDAIVTLSEEALVLYVKALSLLAKSMDIAGAWWARKNRGEIVGDPPSARASNNSSTNPAVGNRVNSVVQWVRNRFNEVLEKAEFVRLKLIDAQKRLPPEHPSHPSNNSSGTTSATMGTSADQVVVTSGVTAEKLMYDRALEMSRAAAINELTGEDLPGCEIAYVTAVRMLEAILETDDDSSPRKNSDNSNDSKNSDTDPIQNGMEAEDRKTVVRLVGSMRTRLTGLRKKMAAAQKRASTPTMNPPVKPPSGLHHHHPSVPAIATTPPK